MHSTSSHLKTKARPETVCEEVSTHRDRCQDCHGLYLYQFWCWQLKPFSFWSM